MREDLDVLRQLIERAALLLLGKGNAAGE